MGMRVWGGVEMNGDVCVRVWVMHVRVRTNVNSMVVVVMRERRNRGVWGGKWIERMPHAGGRRSVRAPRRSCTCRWLGMGSGEEGRGALRTIVALMN